ncbi:Yos1-like protein [Leucosporidium creatinivorum]|uniref:Yos1-like protein n=1 Tax=Leucosporidium creatinivorum TaxID=106004 RepID=A0A1Y2DKZ5_9BASI|nr:Yos1-like protein [Leucosporidium creatinivorum]
MVLFGLGSVAYFCLLLINSVAILNKERFLTPLGLTTNSQSSSSQSSIGGGASAYPNQFDYGQHSPGVGGQIGGAGAGAGGGGDDMSMKMRAVMLVDAVRTLMRIPLIPINIVVIVYEIIFGTGF